MSKLPYIPTREATQFICAEVSYRSGSSASESLFQEVKFWASEILNGEIQPKGDGCFDGPLLIVHRKGSKDSCLNAAYGIKFYEHEHGSTSRLRQLGMWKVSYRVLPADKNGNWVPSTSMIKKALKLLQEKQ